MSGFLFKPYSAGQLNPGGLSVLLDGTNYEAASIYGSDGTLITRLDKNVGTPEGNNKPGTKFYSSKPATAFGQSYIVRVKTADGKTIDYPIENSAARYEGNLGEPGSLQAKDPSIGYGGGGGGAGFAPGMAGQYGVIPPYLINQFPNPVLGQYSPIKPANYNYTDPFKFAEKFGDFNRGEINKNFNQAEDLALQSLNTELKGLQSFIPAASALKRQEVSLDNQFNQSQRTNQINSALPGFVGGVNSDLAGQRSRAQSYAEGRAPDAVTNQAFELGIRSAAADQAAGGGFGTSSSVARKASDLMSANERIKLSQYGDQLLNSNIAQRQNFANFQLAPTEYSNAGSININAPSISGLTQQNLSNITGVSTIPATTAFGSEVQQQQFKTNLEQGTNTFNAGNQLQLSEFNAGVQNSFALDKFGYQVGFGNAVAGATQTDVNTQFQLQQQQQAQQLMQQYLAQAQNSQQLGSIMQLGTALLGGSGLLSSVGSSLANFGGGVKAGANGNGPGGVGPAGIPLTGAPQKGAQLGQFGSGVVGDVGSVLSSINPF